MATTTPSIPSKPVRGHSRPIYGIFIGGSTLDDSWKLKDTCHYRFPSQCRNAKANAAIHKHLTEARLYTTTLKFNGVLEKAAAKEGEC